MLKCTTFGSIAFFLLSSALATPITSPSSGTGETTNPSWPYGQWVLHSFTPNGTLRYTTSYFNSSSAWLTDRLNIVGTLPMAGSIKINASPTARLRWEGAPDLYPTEVHLRLTPTTEALISDKTPLCLPVTDVGRFSTLEHIGFQWNSKGFGPLYKSATSSNAFLDIPAISLVVDAASVDPRGTIWARAAYAWEVLPPLLVTQYDLAPNYLPYSYGVEPVRNFHKGQNGEAVETTRDRDGKLVLHVAMTRTPYGNWDQVLNLGTQYASYIQPLFEFDGGGSQPGTSNHDRYYPVEGPRKHYQVYRSTDKVYPDNPGTAQITTTVRDVGDTMAPTIEQQTEVVWHYPIENTRLVDLVQNQNVLPNQEWAREDANFPRVGNIGRPSYWRTFYSEANTFEAAQAQSASWWLADFILSIVPIPWFADALLGIGKRLTEDMFTPKWHMEECSLQIAWQSNLSSWDGSSARPPTSDQYRYTFSGHLAVKADMYYFKSDTYGYAGYEGDDFVSKYAIMKGFEYYGSFDLVGGI